MTHDEKIKELNSIWYNLITGEYHKDRDCHFYIYSHYYYADQVEYIVEHRGYINYTYEDTHWETYQEAQQELIRLLKEMITEEINCYLEHYGDLNWDQHPRYDKEKLEEIKSQTLNL